MAVAVAAKLAPELIAREPLAEIAALATESFRHLVATPHVVVRVGADIYDDGQAETGRHRARRAVSRAAWWCRPRPAWRQAIAASNGTKAA